MRFRKHDTPVDPVPFPGRADVLDGYAALADATRLAADIVLVGDAERDEGLPVPAPGPTFFDVRAASRPESNDDGAGARCEITGERDIVALLTGYSLQGFRATAVASAADAFTPGLTAAAGKHLPIVVHLVCRAHARQSGSPNGSHDDYHAVADTGAFLMFAGSPQEAADYALIAHRIAERSMTPGVCALDLGATTHAVRNVTLPGDDLVRTYLGGASDVIPCPTDAQKILFGSTRRRVPRWIDLDRPMGVGGIQDADSYTRAVASHRVFFAESLPEMVDDAMREFSTLTGRNYRRATGYRTDDAEIVVIAQGAVTAELRGVVDFLRTYRNLKAGAVGVNVLRPFPDALVASMLPGARTVTVLDRCDSPLAEDPPLLRDVRAALDRVSRLTPAEAPRGRHARRTTPRSPALLSGVYGAGGRLPTFAELTGVYENMLNDSPRRRFYIGAGFDTDTRRFPHLQALKQRLDREYPSRARRALDAARDDAREPAAEHSAQVHSLSFQGALFAGNLFGRSLAHALGWAAGTFPEGGLEKNLQPARLDLVLAKGAGAPCAQPSTTDTAIVSGDHLIESLAVSDTVAHGGTIIAGSVREPDVLWRTLSKRAADWVRNRGLSFHVVDARRIASETTPHASFVDQMAIWALLGAYTRVRLALSDEQAARVAGQLKARLLAEPGMDAATADEVLEAFRRGASECAPVPWDAWGDAAHPVGETEAPWTVREITERDGSVFDAARFWHSVGYLYDRGQSAMTLADPYLSTGAMPARSSAFRDMTPYRLRLPSWLPENCTGCGACWAQCPESALPATVRSPAELIDAAVRSCEGRGVAMVQIKRLGDNLARQAVRIVTQKSPQALRTARAVLEEAFARLVDKAGIEGDRLAALRGEFDALCDELGAFPVADTEVFFQTPETAKPGSGRLLSIAPNPLSCNACGICVAECPDGAFEWTAQTPERIAALHHDWNFLMALPPVDASVAASLVSADDPATHVNRLLDTAMYHTVVGGDGSFPGNGAKTAVHLMTAAIESVMQPRFRSHIERLSSLIERVEERIQGTLRSGIHVNDFEEFTRRLQRAGHRELTPASIVKLLGGEADASRIDAARLERLARLLEQLKEQRESYVSGGDGRGRARLALTIDPSVTEFWHGTYPYNPHAHPWVTQLPGDAVRMAAAVSSGLAHQVAAELAACRRAEDELVDTADAGRNQRDDWRDLTPVEHALIPPVLVLTRPGSLVLEDALSAASSGLPVIVAVLDGEAMASLDRPQARAQHVGSVMRAFVSGGRFAGQSSIGDPGHLMQTMAASASDGGSALIRVHAPDPVACGVAPDRIVEVARSAIGARVFPLWVSRPSDGSRRVSLDENPEPAQEWASRSFAVTEPSGASSTVETTVTPADWAVLQARYRAHFRLASRGHRGDHTRRLPDYLHLDARAREGIQPYIDVRDSSGRHAIAFVSREMVAAAERVAAAWRELRAAAAGEQTAPTETPPEPAPKAPAAPVAPADAHRLLAENLLRLAGYGRDESFFRRSLREFVASDREAEEERE